eukprot:350320-Chlamydomonas_euryale.AAC.6
MDVGSGVRGSAPCNSDSDSDSAVCMHRKDDLSYVTKVQTCAHIWSTPCWIVDDVCGCRGCACACVWRASLQIALLHPSWARARVRVTGSGRDTCDCAEHCKHVKSSAVRVA